MPFNDNQPAPVSARHSAARAVAVVALVFSAIVCTLLIANFIQLKAVDPLENTALAELTSRLRSDPSNQALQAEVRALDLLARKAYFMSRWQLRSGGFLLLGGLTVLLIALRVMGGPARPDLTEKNIGGGEDTWLAAARARKWITASGSGLLAASLIIAFFANGEVNGADGADKAGLSAEQLLGNWTSFRGPGGNGVAGTDKAPVAWDGKSGKGVKWKIAVPKAGNSSPMVFSDRIYLTGADDKVREVYCFDAADGKLVWQKAVTGIAGSPTKLPRVHRDTGAAAPTMTTDGKHVFAIFATGDLVALDLAGKQVWGKNLGVPKNHYGHSSSLITFENLLIVQYDQSENARLLGLDGATGEQVWEAKRNSISWSSPICVNTGSRSELIVTNSKAIDSYNPRTGAKLWGHEVLGGEMGPSAAFAGGMAFGANDYAVVAGISLGAKGTKVLWEYDEILPDTASPLATDKYLFIAASYGLVVCLDVATGKMLWEQEYDDGFYSSPILVGDRVYALDMAGIMHIFSAEGEYKSLGEPQLGEECVATPAVVDGRIFIRGSKHLFCLAEG